MARIAGVDLPRKKRIEIGMTYIYGIGRTTSQSILSRLKIDPNTKTDDLTEEQILSLIHISEPTRLKTRSRMPSSA